MASIIVLFKGSYKLKKSGKSRVILQVIINREKHELRIRDVAVEGKYWDFKSSRIKSNHPEADDLNIIINLDLGRANEILRKYRLSKINITWQLFLSEWRNPSEGNNFIVWMQREIHERLLQGVIKEPTKRKHLGLLDKLIKFKPAIQFSELDQSLLNDFKKFMVRLNNQKNTQGKDFANFKIYVSIAFRRKLINENPFLGFIMPGEEIEPFFLTKEERDLLLDLYRLSRLENKFQQTLRSFLFICYTGLRPSDFLKLKMEQITEMDGITILNIKAQTKTDKSVHLPLSKMALKLIRDEAPNIIEGKIFKTYSTQKMNDYLKYICRIAGIEPNRAKQVSLKTGRHTFATLTLKQSKSGAGLLQVSKLLGHRSVRSTEIYLHVLTDELDELVNKI